MKNKEVFLLLEFDRNVNTNGDVIGVISESEKYINILNEYYGKNGWKEVDFRDVRDSSIEWVRKIRVKNDCKEWKEYDIVCQFFIIDKLL